MHRTRQLAQARPSHRVPRLFDGTGHIFSLYLKMAVEEDKRMVESWEADADGILIFVRIDLYTIPFACSSVLDWFILRCSSDIDLGVDSRHSPQLTGHVHLLPCQYLSTDG